MGEERLEKFLCGLLTVKSEDGIRDTRQIQHRIEQGFIFGRFVEEQLGLFTLLHTPAFPLGPLRNRRFPEYLPNNQTWPGPLPIRPLPLSALSAADAGGPIL